jgi:antibiotic biosynthesis monooxygenase (ABM) superfamily enzyme
MEHEGKALAADETDAHHHRNPGVASVHVRAALTWCAIFPMVALGMTVMGWFAEAWHPVLRALVLTLVVVPMAVYVIVPRLLLAYSKLSGAARNRRLRRATERLNRKARESTPGS